MELTDAADAFLRHEGDRGLATRSLATVCGHLRVLVRALHAQGCVRVADVQPADLDAILLAARDRGVAQSTRKAWASVLRRWFVWAVRRESIARSPALALPVPTDREVQLPEAPLSEEEVERLFAALPRETVLDLRNGCLLELLYGCGLRLAEALALTLDDIDLRARALTVVHGKGGKDRVLPLMGGALDGLRGYLPVRRQLLRGPDTGEVFLNRRGGVLRPETVRWWLQQLTHSVNRRLHPHLFRTSIATHLLRGGADIRHVQEFLGHDDLETTKVYLRMVPGHLRGDYDAAMPQVIG